MQVQISMATGDPKTAQQLATDLIDRLSKAAPDRETSPQILALMLTKAYNARGTAQVKLGNTAAARQDFLAAREITPRDTDAFVNLAVVSLVENKSDEAAGYYESALTADPVNFNALSGLVNLYTAQKQPDKAHSRLDQVLAANPNNASLHFLKARVYGSQQNLQADEAELRKTLELDPNYIGAYLDLGALFVTLKQEDRAIAEYQKIVSLRPDNATAYTLIGMLEDARKNYDPAVDNYRKALEQNLDAAIAANNLAWLYAAQGKGNLDEAVRLAQGAVQKNPTFAGFADTLGWVYYKKGLYEAAADQLQKAVALDEAAARKNNVSANASYHYHLGMALVSKGDKAAAKREIEQALSMSAKANMQFEEANEARKALATL
jgi:tetratricopeptide (TPR) repeat protein